MLNKIEHIGIAVSDIVASNKTYEAILGVAPYKKEAVKSESVITSFFQVGESKIELLQATSTDSAIHKFIEKKGQGIHHIAFGVDDIESEIERLTKEGFRMIHEKPKKGADNMLIAFMHPKDSDGVLIELCQQIKK
ncbi:MAG: methylmalonyl-CoA/ethylmalonyl-CoA epimerase [Parvicella sp.]|jgi:methylmalonyl-CoA/ethylmalonyl-CoA epimerase